MNTEAITKASESKNREGKRNHNPREDCSAVHMSDQAQRCYYSIVSGAVLPGLTLEDALTFSPLYHIRSITRRQFTSPFSL